MESALHTVVKDIEESLYLKELAFGTCPDIERTFNNVFPGAITKTLGKFGFGANFTIFIYRMLSDRTVVAEHLSPPAE